LSHHEFPEVPTALVLLAQRGDRAAYTELYQQYRGLAAYWVGQRLRNPSDQQETAQEVWLSVWRRLPQLREPRKFPGWLFRVVRTHCYSRLRKTRSCRPWAPGRTVALEPEQGPEDPSPGPGAALLARERPDYRSLLAKLGKWGRVLELAYLDGLSVRAIAEELGVPATTVKSRLHVARREARRRFPEEVWR
jgi:RNA polymerase sigma-70 factor (ECF subfamily)